MSDKKGGRSTLSSKSKQQYTDHLYIPDDYLLLIYHAEFYSHYLLLCLKNTLLIYDLNRKNIFRQHKISTHCATFIPNTQYIALASSDRQGRRCILQIWNYQKDSIDSRVTFTFQIQTMKASHRCLIFSSLASLYVIHFPSLKAIFNGKAGNGFHTVYDISKEGLTLVYSTDIKGEVCVRNFTNGETNRCIAMMRTNSNQISERLRRRSMSRRLSRSFVEQEEEIKQEIHIKAHHQNISILRLSPNGYRFVSGSTKGTVLRLYSCLNGQLMSEFQACHVLTTIVDINFIPEGNAIVCLNNENHVRLFHTKMSEEQVICESVRRGREVYEQDNPKAWFSFLGFLKEEWKYQQPFSYFNLQKLSTKDQVKEAGKVKAQNIGMSQIKQEQHDKEGHDVHGSDYQQHPAQKSFNAEEVHVEEVPINQIINGTVPSSQKSSSARHSNSNSEVSIKQGKSIRASSTLIKKKSIQNHSLKSLVKRQADTIVMNRERMLNFRGTIMFQNHINVRVFKGRFYYELKYDPFNGGEMMNKQPKLNLSDVLTARGL